MRFRSTRGASPDVNLDTAVLKGLAADGGLYLPSRIAPLEPAVIRQHRDAPLHEIAMTVLAPFCADAVGRDVLDSIVRRTFAFPIPLVQLDEQTHVLELFHGPTLAFKDVGARFLAGMLAATKHPERSLIVLTATSGDTGGAVADALRDIPGVGAVVLYPEGRISPLQERQITTVGGNVRAVAVAGNFDDCQRLAREAFADRALRRDLILTSANSINVGRLLPQVVYYFAAVAQLPPGGARAVIAVPSGNLGNLTAGLLAKQLGLPVDLFVAGTNTSSPLGPYLESGAYHPRDAVRTMSSAMDVGRPSNLERIMALYAQDHHAIRRDVEVCSASEEATARSMVDTAKRYEYVLDPHTAVGMHALQTTMGQIDRATGVVLGTAHPAKFPDVVEAVLGRSVPEPARLAALRNRDAHAITMEPTYTALRALLLEVDVSG
jgi:threonine synthase